MNTVISEFIQSIKKLPDHVFNDLMKGLQQLEYPKNFLLLKPGKPCRHLWFMVSGAVRYFYVDDNGKESNVWFSLDQDIITETPSFVSQKPSEVGIQLIEDAEFYAIDHETLNTLLERHHALALWYIRLVEKHYVRQIEDRISDLQFLSAKQRYDKLLAQFPGISNRITLGQIASYLNITQETLSRIRSGKA